MCQSLGIEGNLPVSGCPFRRQSAPAQNTNASETQNSSALTRTKEKFIKIHDNMLEKENQASQAQFEADTQDETEVEKKTGLFNFLARRPSCRLFIAKLCAKHWTTWQQSKLHSRFFSKVNSSHVIMAAGVLCAAAALVPSSDRTRTAGLPHSRFISFIYLASFIMHFGAQIWMTFVSGISLYFALPRHAFGDVQRVLFPRYFSINASLSLITLVIFAKHHPIPTWNCEITIQVAGMLVTFFLELLVRLYLTPPMVQMLHAKSNIERAANVGKEVGRYNPGPLKSCPHYVALHNGFRKCHMVIASCNMVTIGCTILHLYHISSKLCVL